MSDNLILVQNVSSLLVRAFNYKLISIFFASIGRNLMDSALANPSSPLNSVVEIELFAVKRKKFALSYLDITEFTIPSILSRKQSNRNTKVSPLNHQLPRFEVI